MNISISKIIIWPKDSNKKPRILEFRKGYINLITGTSKTGKTSIVEILDYCFGSQGCSIPKVGPIRHSSSWYGVLIDTIEGKKLIARKDPEQQNSTDDYFFSEDIEIEIPQIPTKNTNREYIRGLLARLAELPQASSDFNETGSGFKGRASFGDITAFLFQPQYIIANPNTLFYQADEEDHARKLREIFPLVLGAIDSDVLLKQHRLYEVRRILERKRRQLAIKKLAIEDFRGEVRGRYVAAIDLGLANNLGSSLDQMDVDVFVERLKDVLTNWNSMDFYPFDPQRSFVASERLSVLKEQEAISSADLFTLKIRLTQLRELSMVRKTQESNLSRERDRLKPVSWLVEKLQDTNKCPICGEHPQNISKELMKLKETTEQVESLWAGLHILPPMLDAEEVSVRKAIQKTEDLLRQVRLEIDQIEQERALDRDKREQRAVFIGRLQEFINLHTNINDGGDLLEEIRNLEEEERQLLALVDYSVFAQRKEAALFQISQFAQTYGNIMQVETGNDIIQLDTNKLKIRVINKEGQIAWMGEIGSGENWLGYHVTLLLSLQELFFKNQIPYVPSFIVFDQPSQTHFPDDTDEETEHEEFRAVRRTFEACSKAIDRMKGNFQVIITDHAGGSAIKDIKNVNIVERWRKGRKLIPWHWHPSALKICIEQGSSADYALYDLMETEVKPELIDKLGLSISSNECDIILQESQFCEEGIKFKAIVKEVNEFHRIFDGSYFVEGLIHPDLTLHLENIS